MHAKQLTGLVAYVSQYGTVQTIDVTNRIKGLLKRLKHGGYLKTHISFAKLSNAFLVICFKNAKTRPLFEPFATCV